MIGLINFWRGLSPLSSPPSPFAWPSKELLDTWFALSFPPSGSLGCQQDHGYHRQCPTCPPRTSQSHHLKKPSPPKTAHPNQAQIFHPRYHFTACNNTVRKGHNRSGRLSSGSSLRDVVWKRELGLLRREVGPLVALCRRPFEAKQRCWVPVDVEPTGSSPPGQSSPIQHHKSSPGFLDRLLPLPVFLLPPTNCTCLVISKAKIINFRIRILADLFLFYTIFPIVA